MNRRIVSGSIAGMAAIVLATGGTTLGAFDDNSDVPGNHIGAGVLQLDLDGGSGDASLAFTELEPGDRTTRRMWLITNDATSSAPGTLVVTIAHLVDTPGACSVSRGKAEGEIESGISGCTLTGGDATGTPSIGVVSRLLGFRAAVVAAHDLASCTADPTTGTFLPDSAPGGIARMAAAGTTIPVLDASGRPLQLAPGAGICLAVTAYWTPGVTDAAHASPAHPVDNAGQGDSMSVDFRFQLTQVGS